MSKTHFGIALLGFGTVGSGVFDLLQREATEIEQKYGMTFEVKKVLVRNPDAPRAVPLPKHLLAKGFAEILEDPSIDVVVEVMGGLSPAREYITESLKAGKHVITANKKLCGAAGEKLAERARQYDRFFGFAGAVTGFHQLCPSIASSVMIRNLVGIFNGTSNYILTHMEAGLPFDESLRAAQQHGYAEADPSDDVDGIDTRNKLIIVAKLAFGIFLDLELITPHGIRAITKADMEFAHQLGYTIKLLGICRLVEDDKLYAGVAPCLIPLTDPLASVRDVFNGIQVYDALRGTQGMIASGAGSKPTTAAIFSDLISLAKGHSTLWPRSSRTDDLKFTRSQPSGLCYVRFQARNSPGVLSKITKAFGKFDINLRDVVQRGEENAPLVPVVVTCGPVDEKILRQALKDIDSLGLTEGHPLVMRIEASEVNVNSSGVLA